MKKYSWIIMTLCMMISFSMSAFAGDLTVGYTSMGDQMNLVVGGAVDVSDRSSLKASYTIINKSDFDISARYKMALLKGFLNVGPMIEGQYTKRNDLKSLEYGAGIFVEKPADDSKLGLSTHATYMIDKDAETSGIMVGMEATFPLAQKIFLGADLDMGVYGAVSGTDITFKLGYKF